MEKACSKCGVVKPHSDYQKRSASKKDGLTSACKDCLREYDARRFRNDPRVKARHLKYQKTDAGKKSMQKAKERWRDQNPEKRAAHVLLGNRIRDGHIIKPDNCQDCGAAGRIEGHHHDYAKPLEVEWLCPQCHTNRHKESER